MGLKPLPGGHDCQVADGKDSLLWRTWQERRQVRFSCLRRPAMKLSYSLLLKFIYRSCLVCLVLSLTLIPGAAAIQPFQSYLVQGPDVDQVARLVNAYGGRVTSRLEIIDGVGALLTAAAAGRLRYEPGVTTIHENGSVKIVGGSAGGVAKRGSWPETDYPDVVGADVVWQYGVTGEGVTVAVVDTGLLQHPGWLRNTTNQAQERIAAWVDFVDGSKRPVDPNGHGTHVAGIIANTHTGADGEWNGVSPGVKLVGVRVLDGKGYGTYESVVQGIQWVVDNKDVYNIQVLNMSIVAPVQSPYWADPLNQAVMRAWQAGIVVVAAAGNGGPAPLSIGVPGNNPYVITVGAFTDHYTPYDWNDDYLAPFSAAGPTLDGFVKPDLVAPGGHIVSTMHPGAFLLREHQANKISQFYFSMAGTSQSAAVVSGVAALVRSANPQLTPDQVKYRLMFTANPWVDIETTDAIYSMWQQGAGRVSAPEAVFAELEGTANHGLDIGLDLAGLAHYEGYSYYDDLTGEFRLRGGFGNWSGGYGNWSGGYGNWSGGFGNWSGSFGNWSGGFGNWSGGYGNWSGGFGNWSGGFGNWSGGFGNWSGGFGNWSGGFGNWSGGFGNWSGGLEEWIDGCCWTGAIKLWEWVEE
jgi:serine protease AprX